MAQEEENKGTDTMSHDTGVAKGEEQLKTKEKNPVVMIRAKAEAGRPTGTSTARDSTSINPEDRRTDR